ncbi:MAG: hypothetical protein ACHQF2_06515 [Flavobacteriales bacterium]
MKKAISIVFTLSLLLCCKKDKTVTMVISGTISDGINGGGVANTSVVLSYQKYENGIASTAFSTIGSYTTSSDGRYSFSFEKPPSIMYRLQINRTDYFGISEDINPDNLSAQNENIRNYTLYPSATFTISLKNLNPVNAQDQVLYQNLSENNSCPSCCNNSLKVLTGTTVDTSFTCPKYGNTYVKFQWIVTKNSIINTFVDSIFCPTGQLTTYQVNY